MGMAEASYSDFHGKWTEDDRGTFVDFMGGYANLGFMKKNALKAKTLTQTIAAGDDGASVKVTGFNGSVVNLTEGQETKEGDAMVKLIKCFEVTVTKGGKTQTVTRTIVDGMLHQTHTCGDLTCTLKMKKVA